MPPSSSSADNPMARLPANLVSLFTQALKSYQLSNATFRVLCSLPSASADPTPQPPKLAPPALLVLDSSFNPPTLAHQRMALSALAQPNPTPTSRILLLLAINNADKAPKPAAFPQRLAMMYVFAQDLLLAQQRTHPNSNPNANLDIDIAVTTEPYFHAKSSAIAASDFYQAGTGEGTGEGTDVEQVYLTGFDTLIRVFDPKYYPPAGAGAGSPAMASVLDPFFERARLRVTMRPDAEWGDAAAQLRYLETLRQGELERVGGRTQWAERVEMVTGRDGDGEEEEVIVSSTKVRDAVRRRDWDALARLVSEGVAAWIWTEGLYREGG
ncbi:Nucleotidylyl transferase [Whalleya microplaca]|nr:Nucleotidylyl transferase [Whalleya microplaca]